MHSIFPLAGAMLVLLEVLSAFQVTAGFLPMGGSHIAQIAIVLGFAFVAYEVAKVFLNDR